MEGLAQSGLLIQAVVAFGGGIISFLSPCVLPLVPGYVAMITGYSTVEIEEGRASGRRVMVKILQFVAGFTLVFVALGAGATTISSVLRRNLPDLTRVAGIVIVVMGLVIVAMAVSDRGILGFLSRERRFDVRPSRLGAWAPPVMGMAFAFGWTACIGPILTVVLATAATQETVGRGVALLTIYSLGLGLPFLVAGVGLARVFGRAKRWLRPINLLSGFALAAFGVVMLTGSLSRWSAWLSRAFADIPWLEQLANI